jgi:hypothetical protein
MEPAQRQMRWRCCRADSEQPRDREVATGLDEYVIGAPGFEPGTSCSQSYRRGMTGVSPR